jgi:hypothetical protein
MWGSPLTQHEGTTEEPCFSFHACACILLKNYSITLFNMGITLFAVPTSFLEAKI